MDPLADAAYAIVAALLFAFVATRVARRQVETDLRRALRMFSLWWYGVSFFLMSGALLSLLDWSRVDASAAGLTLSTVSMLSVCAAVWGLVYYVSYLYTGRSTVFYPMFAYYSGVFAVMLFGLLGDPSGGELSAWHESIVRLAILTGPILTGAIVALLLPAVGALLAYGRLYPRVAEREQRYRIGLATTSLVGWFSLAILARVAGIADTPQWTVIGRLLALGAALGVLFAYAPPGWLRRLLHFQVDAETPGARNGSPTLRMDRRLSPLP